MCNGQEEFSNNVQLGFQVLVGLIMIGLILWGLGWVLLNFIKPILLVSGVGAAVVLILWSIGCCAKRFENWLDKT